MLFKNAYKLFKKKKFQLVAVGIIIFLSSFLYTSMFNAMKSLETTIKTYFDEYVQEDFSIDIINHLTEREYRIAVEKGINISPMATLGDIKSINEEFYDYIINERELAFEEEYSDYDLELRESKDILFNYNNGACKFRALKENDKINKTKVEEGRKPEKNNEIGVTRAFSESTGLNIGDTLDINNKDYEIVGFILFPDYTLPMFGQEFILDSGKINVALFSDEEFDTLKGKEEFRFGGLSKGDFNKEDFNEKVEKTFKDKEDLSYVINISETTSNMRSGMIYDEVVAGKVSVVALSVMIASIAIIIVAIIVYKILQSEKGQIGVLKAMGYLRKEIGLPYLILITIIALPMLLIGSIAGFFAGEPLKNFYLIFYLLPKEGMVIDYSIAFVAVVVPLVFFLGLSYLIIMKMLSKKPLDLLKVGEESKETYLTKFADKLLSKAKTTTKFKYSFLLRNSGKFYVFLIGILFSSMLVIMGLMMPEFFSKSATDRYTKVDYQYEAILDVTKGYPELKAGEEKILTVPTAKYNDENITLKGLEKDNELYKLYNSKGKEITDKLNEGVIITKSFNTFYDKEVGDKITLSINNEEYEFEIKGMSEEYGSATIYMEIESLSNLISKGESKDLYTGIYSKEEINKDDYSIVMNKIDMLDQAKSMQGFIYVSIGGILGTSIFIAALVLYVLTSLTIEDNYYNISLLKVMGYSKKEVNSMILNSYLGYAVMAYLISVPITVFSITLITDHMGKNYNMVLPLEFSLWQGVVGFIVILIIFYIGSLSAKKKIEKISLQEVLKAYSE